MLSRIAGRPANRHNRTQSHDASGRDVRLGTHAHSNASPVRARKRHCGSCPGSARLFPIRSAGGLDLCDRPAGSNTFRRIIRSFQNGKYVQRPIEKKALGVGDDVEQHGRISETKLVEIGTVLTAFKSSCAKEGATRVVAVGTAAFRDAANGARVPGIAAKAGVAMEIASEQRESELAYMVGSLGRDDYAVIDHGSRSIELVSRGAEALRYTVSTLDRRIAYEKFFADEATRPPPSTGTRAIAARGVERRS